MIAAMTAAMTAKASNITVVEATAGAADAGVVEAGVIAAAVSKAVLGGEIYRPPNMPPRRAANFATTTIAASSAATTIVARKARGVRAHRQRMSPRKRFFCPANHWQNIGTRHQLPPLLRLPLSNKSPTAIRR